MLSRRHWISGLSSVGFFACAGAEPARHSIASPPPAPSSNPSIHDNSPASQSLSLLENALGGQLGLYAKEVATGRGVAYRGDQRFAMCSTFKCALAAWVLCQVDRGDLKLDDLIAYGESDLLDYAPKTRESLPRGAMSVAELTQAAVEVSDNTAANLLLRKIGGPIALTRFFRDCHDDVSRLDRNEPSLNENVQDDLRDTTTPRAMADFLERAALGNTLSVKSRAWLIERLKACKTGLLRLRAGLPQDWLVGDKTGTGERGAAGDIAVVWPPNRSPVVIAAYVSGSDKKPEQLNHAFEEMARVVGIALAG